MPIVGSLSVNWAAEVKALEDEVERLRAQIHSCGECGAQMVGADFLTAVDKAVEGRVPELQERNAELHGEVDHLRAALADKALLLERYAVVRDENERLRSVLRTVQQWDSLNPPAPSTDFPWLRKLVDDALGDESKGRWPVKDVHVADGVARPSAMATWLDWFIGEESLGQFLKHLEGKRVRVTVEVLDDERKAGGG